VRLATSSRPAKSGTYTGSPGRADVPRICPRIRFQRRLATPSKSGRPIVFDIASPAPTNTTAIGRVGFISLHSRRRESYGSEDREFDVRRDERPRHTIKPYLWFVPPRTCGIGGVDPILPDVCRVTADDFAESAILNNWRCRTGDISDGDLRSRLHSKRDARAPGKRCVQASRRSVAYAPFPRNAEGEAIGGDGLPSREILRGDVRSAGDFGHRSGRG